MIRKLLGKLRLAKPIQSSFCTRPPIPRQVKVRIACEPEEAFEMVGGTCIVFGVSSHPSGDVELTLVPSHTPDVSIQGLSEKEL